VEEQLKKKQQSIRSLYDMPYWAIEVGRDGVPYIGEYTAEEYIRLFGRKESEEVSEKKGGDAMETIRGGIKMERGEKKEEDYGTPYHYSFAIQPVDYIHANHLDFFEGNVIKYVTRHKYKNGPEDIRKAIHYLKMILKYEYGEE